MADGVSFADRRELPPRDAWEKTESGIFDRSQVISGVETWVLRVNALFRTIEEWLGDLDALRFERIRTFVLY